MTGGFLIFEQRADWSGKVSWQAFANGDTTSALSKSLQQNMPFADALITVDRVAGWVTVGEGYYLTDTHWNERGARRAAEAIAADLRRWGLAPAAQLTSEVTVESGRERVGDLIRLAGLDQVSLPMRPRGDLESPVRIKQTAKQAVGILDDIAAPEVAVIGTSFSRRGGFIGFLSLVLAAPVANMAQDGGGVFTAAIDYFRNSAFTETPPRTVVWEIPERLLDEPLADSEKSWAKSLMPRPLR